jgi:CO/xanthine dehydrogenase Mo-binding subunit
MVGNAVMMACRELKAKIVGSVAKHAGVGSGEVRLADGWALWGGSRGNGADGARGKMPIAEAYMLAEAEHGTLGAVGHYNTPKEGVHGDYRGGTIGASPAYSFTAHVAEVEVDEDTGFVNVKKIWVAHDCGKALNPLLVEGQMEGSAYMGFAEALMEEQVVKRGTPEGGLHNAPSLLDYRIPPSLDCPEFISLIVEASDPEGPYGAKEAGEGPLHPSLPAIANAIYDAVGVRIDRLPFTPDRVWRALREAREQAAQKAG